MQRHHLDADEDLTDDDRAIIKGVGGKAFPNDFNWVCPDCGNENRAFEDYCPYCEHADRGEPIVIS